MWIYRWFYKIQWFYNQIYMTRDQPWGLRSVILTFKLQWQNWNNTLSGFNPVTVRNTDTPFDKAVTEETDMSNICIWSCDWFLRTDMSNFHMTDTDLQSDLQPILHANLHLDLHTDLLADLQNNLHAQIYKIYKKSTSRSAGSATLVSPDNP